MSATRSPKPASRPTDPSAAGLPQTPSGRRPKRLAAVLLLALAWSGALLLMDLWTSNPRLVSRDQVLASDAVVIGRLSRLPDDRVKIERVFLGDLTEGDEIRVANLPEVSGLAEGAAYLMPLAAFRNDFVVTTLEGQKVPPMVYQPTPETVDQVKAILRDRL